MKNLFKSIFKKKESGHRPSWTYSSPCMARIEREWEKRGVYGPEFMEEIGDMILPEVKFPDPPKQGEGYEEYIRREPYGTYHDWVHSNGTTQEVSRYNAQMRCR